MKEGWTYKKLGELFPIVMGKTPPRNVSRYWDEKKETNNLWVSIADLSKYEGKEIHETKEHISDEGKQGIKQIPKGSLLVSFKLTLGKMAFAGEKLYTNEAIMSLQRRDDVDLVFLYYYFSFLDWNKIASGNEKVKGKTLNKKSLSEIPVAYIPLMEQHSIVARLDAAFAHIDALKANAEKQLAEASQLFQAELTECMRPKEGWEEKALGEVSVFSQGIQVDVNLQTEICSPGKVRFLRIIDVTQGNVPPRYIDDPGEKYYLKADEIAMVRYGTVGFVCYGFEGVIANNLFKISIKDKSKLQSNYLQYFLKSDLFQSNIRKGVGGAALPAIKFGDIKYIMLGVPPLSEQQRIVSRLDALSANIKKLEELQQKTLAECDALKQAMLREVFE